MGTDLIHVRVHDDTKDRYHKGMEVKKLLTKHHIPNKYNGDGYLVCLITTIQQRNDLKKILTKTKAYIYDHFDGWTISPTEFYAGY